MYKEAWLEISLLVDGELAEAVAEVLSRFVSGGVVVESTAIEMPQELEPTSEGEGRPTGPLRVSGYLPIDGALADNRRRLEEALWYLGRIRPLPEPEFRQIQAADWAEAWKERFHPFRIGERLLVAPTWADVEPGDRVVLRIDPGMAFGTGTHPTTRLCLELLDEILDTGRLRPSPVIDLGCGSGILAIASLKLGAERALAVDTDPEAVKAALENAAANGVLERLEVGTGSVAEVIAGSYGIQQAEVVVANIITPVLVRLLGEGLHDLVSPGGLLILSGILEEQAGEVLTAANEQGLRLVDRRQEGDWLALVVR